MFWRIFNLLAILVILFACPLGPSVGGPSGVEGWALERLPYCAVRPGEQCCPGRNDRCTMPMHDTLCYCDIFCNRTQTDCCPDFLPVCMGVQRITSTTSTIRPRPPIEGKRSNFNINLIEFSNIIFGRWRQKSSVSIYYICLPQSQDP